MRSPTSGCSLMPALAGRPAAIIDAGRGSALLRAPGARRRPVARPLPGRVGDIVSLLPWGDGVEGVTTDGLAYPLADEPLPPGRRAACRTSGSQPTPRSSVRRGLLLVVESPATLSR